MGGARPRPTAWMPVGPAARARHSGGELVYAIGDVHGCYAKFRTLLAAITEDAAARAGNRYPLLILLGDYVDRGTRSAEVVEAITWLRRRGDFELHALRGNHEQALLDFLDRPAEGEDWLGFGGVATLRSYGVEPPDGPDALERARDDLLARMPAAHLRLLEATELIVEVGSYAFVHAGIRPGRPLAEQAAQDMLWIREEFLDSAVEHPRCIVHGHSWESGLPQVRPHRIGLDTGAYSTGALTALRLDGADGHYLQVRD